MVPLVYVLNKLLSTFAQKCGLFSINYFRNNKNPLQPSLTMSSPPLRGSAGSCPSRRSRPPGSPRIGGASTRSTSRARCGPACACGKQVPCLERASARSLRAEPSQVWLRVAASQPRRVRRERGLSRAERSCSRHRSRWWLRGAPFAGHAGPLRRSPILVWAGC